MPFTFLYMFSLSTAHQVARLGYFRMIGGNEGKMLDSENQRGVFSEKRQERKDLRNYIHDVIIYLFSENKRL